VNSLTQTSVEFSDPRNIGRGSGCVPWIVEKTDPAKLVPIGAIGELVIEGPIVGRGYFNDEDKTAAVFLNAPYWLQQFGRPESRLYKTGDLVQYTFDGCVRYALLVFFFRHLKLPKVRIC